jgi:hypothetical protein
MNSSWADSCFRWIVESNALETNSIIIIVIIIIIIIIISKVMLKLSAESFHITLLEMELVSENWIV